MNSKQNRKFKRGMKKLSDRIVQGLESVIAKYGDDSEVITKADLIEVVKYIKESK